MYEEKDFDAIMEEKLSKVKELFPTLDRRQGSVIYTTLAPDALEEAMMYMALDKILAETFANTASRRWLIRRCADRGITPVPATYAKGLGTFLKGDGTPFEFTNLNDVRFTCDKFVWVLTEKISDGQYLLTCQTAGEEPNSYTGRLIPISSIDGLSSANLTEISVYGENEEDTEVLRKRYIASFKNVCYGFNKPEYIQVINALQGVGGVKPYRASKLADDGTIINNNPGHVAIVIQDSEFGVPTQTLIDKVQTAIDPTQNTGDGIGLAPIDHEVHIRGVGNTQITIGLKLVFVEGIVFEDCKNYIKDTINQHLATLNKDWQNSNNIVVRISRIEASLLNLTDYIIDVYDTTINGVAENFVVQGTDIVTLKEVTNNE